MNPITALISSNPNNAPCQNNFPKTPREGRPYSPNERPSSCDIIKPAARAPASDATSEIVRTFGEYGEREPGISPAAIHSIAKLIPVESAMYIPIRNRMKMRDWLWKMRWPAAGGIGCGEGSGVEKVASLMRTRSAEVFARRIAD